MLGKISRTEKDKNRIILLACKHDKQQKTDTDNSMVFTGWEGVRDVKEDKRGQIHGDRRGQLNRQKNKMTTVISGKRIFHCVVILYLCSNISSSLNSFVLVVE